jgi:hypothetical protein
VFFGATQAIVTSAGPTGLTVTVPLGATYQYISVTNLTNNLTAYSVKPFLVPFTGAIAFDAKQDYSSGVTPNSVSIGDIDGDAKADMVVTNSGSNTISIFRNTSTVGTINWATKVDLATNPTPRFVSIGDIDGDGKLDLVITNEGSNNVSVYRNTSSVGTIGFDSKVDFTTGTAPVAVAIGDINGDGKPDLTVANYSSNTISILQNTSVMGGISFTAKVDFPTGVAPVSIAIGDIDGDSKSDIAVISEGEGTTPRIILHRNTSTMGNLSFVGTSYLGGPGNYFVSIGDVDGDGKPDLTVVNGGDKASVFRNTSSVGSINFATKVDFSTGPLPGSYPSSVAVGDVDGDSKIDIVATNRSGNNVAVLRNTSISGAVSFSNRINFATESYPMAVSIGDLDGDGKPDLAVANQNSGSVSILKQATPQGILTANGPFCASGTGKLTWTSTAGTGPYTVVYNDGTTNRTATNVTSGTAFNVFTNPVTGATTYTLVSVTYPDNSVQTGGFSVSSATITVNPLPIVSTSASSVFVDSTITLSPNSGGTWVSSDPTKAIVTNTGLVTGKEQGVVNFIFTATATGCSATTSNITVVNALSSVQAAEFSPNYLLVPQLTFAQISAISSPKRGMIVYDLTNNCLRVYNGTMWKRILLD